MAIGDNIAVLGQNEAGAGGCGLGNLSLNVGGNAFIGNRYHRAYILGANILQEEAGPTRGHGEGGVGDQEGNRKTFRCAGKPAHQHGYQRSICHTDRLPYLPQPRQVFRRGACKGVCRQGFELCVSEYSTAALYKAEHTDELVADGKTHLRIDYKVSGLGSHSCGPALEPQYRLAEKEIDL